MAERTGRQQFISFPNSPATTGGKAVWERTSTEAELLTLRSQSEIGNEMNR
jgi:hypothetical protein